MRAVPLVTLLLLTAVAVKPQSSPPSRMPDEVAVFAVRPNDQSFVIDPIVIVHYGAGKKTKVIPSLSDATRTDSIDADNQAFESAFYKPGTAISVFKGGERIGTATIRNTQQPLGEEGGCTNLSATISLNSSATPALLAANTNLEIPGHRSTRRPATPKEIAIVSQLAKQWLAEYGLDQRLLKQGIMGTVTSTELRKGGGRAIIGRFDVKSRRSLHSVFAVAEQNGTRYQLTLASLVIQNDLDSEKDKQELVYIDQLDINNDGIDELITMESLYESWGYTIWEFDAEQKVWRTAYHGRC